MDRDLLIKTSANVETLCKSFETFDKKLDYHIELSHDRLEKKVSNKMFLSIIGIIVGVMIISGGLMISNKTCVSENKILIEQNKKEINKNIRNPIKNEVCNIKKITKKKEK